MKKNFTRLLNVCLLWLLPALAFGQPGADYTLKLQSGSITPVENSRQFSRTDLAYIKSGFSGKRYLTIQFYQLPSPALRSQLQGAGIQLLDYIPHLAYTAAMSDAVNPETLAGLGVRSVLQLNEEQKIEKNLFRGDIPQHAVKVSGYADLTVLTYERMTAASMQPALQAAGAELLQEVPGFKMIRVRIPAGNLRALAALPFVQWVEPIDPPNEEENLPGRTLHRVNILNDGVRNLKGDDINIGIWDGGSVNTNHQDFLPAGRVTIVRAGAVSDHGTHVAGTITGKGLVNRTAQGMAPNARLYSWDFLSDVPVEMATAIPNFGLLVSSHSYGSTGTPNCQLTSSLLAYSTSARNTDLNINNNPSHLHVHSAGNSGTACSGGYLTITGSGKPAKNNLVVANITTTEAIVAGSSSGPVHDGRIKPEISAMGTNVFSTWIPNSSYATISGTSMSTPGVSGTAALLYQRYRQLNSNANPPSALIKNIICNGAEDLGNPGPDYRFGFGRINALKSVKILEDNRFSLGNVATAENDDITINVPAGTARLKVMLTWNDPAATANAATALMNNLDLSVINGANTTLPWVLAATTPSLNATRGTDNINNIEQVTIDNPEAGTYTLRVAGTLVGTGPSQDYALTWSVEAPYLEITYPNGGESFNPGSQEVITWDKIGVTGTQTLEYSLDNGANWTLISSGIAASTSRFTWTVPAANTSTALIRVTAGSLSDVSDNTFRILGSVTGFTGSGASCNPGEITFSWTAVANANLYDIYRLNTTTGQFELLAGNITGSPYTHTGLTPGASGWYSIVAKNNTSGAESPRSNAVQITASGGGSGLGAVGSISGQNNVCGATTGVTYSIASVSGATSYTWTVPPGATIASGQGSTNITVDYPAGSSSGNVAVTATNGTCTSSPSILAVNVGGGGITAPLSAGNQTATVCPADPVPTLTASATVGAGFTLVWYNAPTGGSVVASPTLSAPGTITYYAASRDNTTNCESSSRTAVTLTITQVAPASITAAGPTSFCQGGNVTLNASTGGSYQWRLNGNPIAGANGQTYVASAAGTYSVTVTTGTCESTSSTISVTVSPTPTASITAGGPTTFCQGLNVQLTASAGSSWLWSNGATTQSITATTSGNYTVTVTNGSGCSATSSATTVTVNANPPASITAGGATSFCQGGSVTLTANTGTAYLWSNGATTQSINVSGPIGTTNYSVQVTQAGGCVSNSPTTSVTVNPVPVAAITAGGPTTFCEPGSVTLTASAGSSWLWSNGATTQSINLSGAAATGNYNVRVTNASGCSATSGNTAVTINPQPVVSLSASPYTALFPGLNTTLSATVSPAGTYTYTWTYNGGPLAATGTTIPVTLSNLGTYAVTATNAGGCSGTSNSVTIRDSATARLFIMPNPNDGQFEISYYSPASNNYTVTIADGKGAVVYSKAYSISAPYQRLSVDLRKNGAGIYMIMITDNRGKRLATGKVMISPR